MNSPSRKIDIQKFLLDEPLEIIIPEGIEPSGTVDLRHLFIYDYESYARRNQPSAQTASNASSLPEETSSKRKERETKRKEREREVFSSTVHPTTSAGTETLPKESTFWRIFGIFCLLLFSALAGAYYNGWIDPFAKPLSNSSSLALHSEVPLQKEPEFIFSKEPEIIPEPEIHTEEPQELPFPIFSEKSVEPLQEETPLPLPENPEISSVKTIDEIFQEGLLCEQEKRYADAIQKYQEVISLDSQHSKAYYRMGYVYHVLDELPKATLLYQKAIEIYPQFFQAYNNLGIIYLDENNLQKAHSHFLSAIDIQPNSAEAYNNLANTFKKMENDEEAIKYYEKARSLRPDLHSASWNLALIHFHQNRFDSAQEILLPLLELSEVDFKFEIYNLLGKIASQEDKTEEAISHYQTALTLAPDSHGILNNLGIAYTKQEKYEDAIRVYQRSIQLNPKYEQAYNNLGIVYAKQDQFKQAIEHYQKALELNPKYADAYYNYGVALEEQNQLQEARNEYLTCLKQDKSHFKAYNNIGQLYIKWDIDPERALLWIDRSLALNTHFPEAYLNRGWILLKLKRYRESSEAFETYLKLSPHKNNEVAKQALEKLQNHQIQKNHQEALKNYLKILKEQNSKASEVIPPAETPKDE